MIDKNSTVPLYSQLRDEIIKKIKDGKYKPGDAIPSENELCQIYSLSRPTVRQAIGDLANKGYLTKIKGKGTFVAEIVNKKTYSYERGFLHTALGCNDQSNRILIDVQIVNGKYRSNDVTLNDQFHFEYVPNMENSYVKAQFVYEEAENVKVYSVSFLPEKYFPDAYEKIKQNAISLELIGAKYPIDPMHCKCKLFIENADQHIAQQLEVPENTPVLVISNHLQGRNGNIVEICNVYYNSLTSNIVFMKGRER